METSTQYRRFAQECRRLAREAKTERHRKIMEEMARAWDRLASEADEEASHAPTCLALIGFFLCVWRSPLACQAEPHLRH
jgi:hypothetical protein